MSNAIFKISSALSLNDQQKFLQTGVAINRVAPFQENGNLF